MLEASLLTLQLTPPTLLSPSDCITVRAGRNGVAVTAAHPVKLTRTVDGLPKNATLATSSAIVLHMIRAAMNALPNHKQHLAHLLLLRLLEDTRKVSRGKQ